VPSALPDSFSALALARYSSHVVVQVGSVPLDHRLGRQREAEGLALVLAVLLLAGAEVADVVLGRGSEVVVERRHGPGRAERCEEGVVELGHVVLAVALLVGEQLLLVCLTVGCLGEVHLDARRLLEGRDERLDGAARRAGDQEHVDLTLVAGFAAVLRRCRRGVGCGRSGLGRSSRGLDGSSRGLDRCCRGVGGLLVVAAACRHRGGQCTGGEQCSPPTTTHRAC
jgi:hypothetical protein